MKKHPEHNRILLVSNLTNPDRATGTYPDVFRAAVAVLDPDGTPRNWSKPWAEWRLSGDTGGFEIKGFLNDDRTRILVSCYGREIESEDAREYADVAKALTAYYARFDALNSQLGFAADEVDSMARMMAALRVTAVWYRPNDNYEQWLSKGDWQSSSVGDYVNRLRHVFGSYCKAA